MKDGEGTRRHRVPSPFRAFLAPRPREARSRGHPSDGYASGTGAVLSHHGKPHGADGRPLTRFPTVQKHRVPPRSSSPIAARAVFGSIPSFLASLFRSSFEFEPAVARFAPRLVSRTGSVPTLGARASRAVVNRVRAPQNSPCGFPWRGGARGVAPSA